MNETQEPVTKEMWYNAQKVHADAIKELRLQGKEPSPELLKKVADNLGSGLLSESEAAIYKAIAGKRFIDTERIPLICQDIRIIHEDIKGIKDSMTWITRLIIGAVVIALLGMVFTKK